MAISRGIQGDSNTNQDLNDGAKGFNLRPAIYLMIVSACYNTRKSKRRIGNVVLWVYQIAVTLIFLTFLMRNFAHFENSVVSYISTTLITLQCLGSCVFSWKLFSTKYGHYHEAMNSWQNAVSKMIDRDITIDFGFFNKRQAITVGIAITLELLCIAIQFVITYILIPPPEKLRELGYNVSIAEPFEDTLFSRFLVTIPMTIQIITLITPAFFLIVVNCMLRTGLRGFNKYLTQVVTSKDGESLNQLEMCRQIHVDLCQVVSMLDRDLCLLYGNIYIWTLGLGITVLYLLLKFQQTFVGVIIYLFYLGITLGMLFSMSISAAYVHEEAHAPLDTIYYINVETISLEKATQLNLFLSKLTGTQVGFTTFGLLTITKEFILTIAGVFLTYFAVLYTTL